MHNTQDFIFLNLSVIYFNYLKQIRINEKISQCKKNSHSDKIGMTLFYYSSTGAPTGHTPAHEPQLMQAS